ncbi:DUF4468 domain-containing protein [Chryseobacterium sp. Mn2064]|uniref:DUF4468 domain-containing protein n=1 Tax=Chryseobacterium sp. Mn2064 TaxID=3395263 RepID=UPI003BD257F2
MKKIILLTFLLLNSLLFCQELTYEEAIQVDSSVTKQELYDRAKMWLSDNFRVGEKFNTNDKGIEGITADGVFKYKTNKLFFGLWCIVGNVHFKIDIFTADGEYGYAIHSLTHEGSYFNGNMPISYGLLTTNEKAPQPSRGGANDKVWKDIKVKSNEKIMTIISDLKQAMSKKIETKNEL